MKASEYNIQVALSQYMALQYPDILFHMDLSGIRLPIGLAVKAKKLNPYHAWPDIFIAKPRVKFEEHQLVEVSGGLFIELKRSRKEIYKSNGELRKNSHINEQNAVLQALRLNGYQAVFACGFEETKKIIDEYLK
jgi:hypothetical protein